MIRPALARLLAALLAFHAGAASAQLYKWVDEHGRVNYSNQLPADGKLAQKSVIVEDRVSVYSPDPALLREVAANRERLLQAAYERQSPQVSAASVSVAPSPDLSASVAYDAYPVEYAYWGGGRYGSRRQLPLHKVPQVKLPPNAIAGATVGLFSIMPGNSSPVPGTWSPSTPQQPAQHRPSSFGRNHWERR